MLVIIKVNMLDYSMLCAHWYCSRWSCGSEHGVHDTVHWITQCVKQLRAGAWWHCIVAPAGGAAVDWVITDERVTAADDVVSMPVSGVHHSHGPSRWSLLWYIFLPRFVISCKH